MLISMALSVVLYRPWHCSAYSNAVLLYTMPLADAERYAVPCFSAMP